MKLLPVALVALLAASCTVPTSSVESQSEQTAAPTTQQPVETTPSPTRADLEIERMERFLDFDEICPVYLELVYRGMQPDIIAEMATQAYEDGSGRVTKEARDWLKARVMRCINY